MQIVMHIQIFQSEPIIPRQSIPRSYAHANTTELLDLDSLYHDISKAFISGHIHVELDSILQVGVHP